MVRHCMKRAVMAGVVMALMGTLAPAVGQSTGFGFAVPHSGQQEVPLRPTSGSGIAYIAVSPDQTHLIFRLFVRDIRNVTAAHIHVGPPGVNGPVVLPLFGNAPPGGGLRSGMLSEGTATAANLTGPLQGRPLSELVAAMRSGNAYVNVHTNDGVAPTNSGAGDFPGGEIRGDIGRAGRRPRI